MEQLSSFTIIVIDFQYLGLHASLILKEPKRSNKISEHIGLENVYKLQNQIQKNQLSKGRAFQITLITSQNCPIFMSKSLVGT